MLFFCSRIQPRIHLASLHLLKLKLLFENFGLCLPCFRGKGEGIWVIVYPWFEQERSGKGPGARIRGRECHRESEHREEAHQPPST
jgi:hypothetical protein